MTIQLRQRANPLTLVVPGEDVLVVLLLHGGEFDSDDELGLRGHAQQHVGFESTQHVRTQHVVQLFDLFLLRDVAKNVLELQQVLKKTRR